jgi:hypothetical protein
MVDLMIECIKSDDAGDEEKNPESDDIHVNDQFEKDSKLQCKGKSKKEFDELDVVATALVLTIAGRLFYRGMTRFYGICPYNVFPETFSQRHLPKRH